MAAVLHHRRSDFPFILPSIPGVVPLSKSEVKKDLKEIESNLPDESESDESVKSEDVIPSTYPVKPRRTPKFCNKVSKTANIGEDYDTEQDAVVDDTLEFLRLVETSLHDIFEAERDRERLEIQYNALRDTFLTTSKRFHKEKQEQENYLTALQGLCVRKYSFARAYRQQNCMLFDMLNALRNRKDASAALEEALTSMKQAAEEKLHCSVPAYESNKSGNKIAGLPVTETPLLRVKVHSAVSATDREHLLYCGQLVITPMGEGEVVALRPTSQSLVIRLQFGLLYSTIANTLTWCTSLKHRSPQHFSAFSAGSELDASSDRSLLNKWTALQQCLETPVTMAQSIANTVAVADSQGCLSQAHCDGDATDNDNDDMSTVESMAAGEMDVDYDSCPVPSSPSLTVTSQSMDEPQSLITKTLALSQSNMISRSQSHKPHGPHVALTQPPILAKAQQELSSVLKIHLSREQQVLNVGYHSLPMLLAHPETLPLLLSKAENTSAPTAQLFDRAFSSSDGLTKLEMQELQSTAMALKAQTCEVEQRQSLAMRKVTPRQFQIRVDLNSDLRTDVQMHFMRRRLTRVTQEMTMTRLAMFSRRARHCALLQRSTRSPLNPSLPPTLAPVPAGGGGGSTKAAQVVRNEVLPNQELTASVHNSKEPFYEINAIKADEAPSIPTNDQAAAASSEITHTAPVSGMKTSSVVEKDVKLREPTSRSRVRPKRRADDDEGYQYPSVAEPVAPNQPMATAGAGGIKISADSATVDPRNESEDVDTATDGPVINGKRKPKRRRY